MRRRARRAPRPLRWSAVAIGAVVSIGSLAVGGSPASAEVAGDPHSPVVVFAATVALNEYHELAVERMSTKHYDQAAAYRAGYEFRQFARARDKAARATAAEVGVDPRALRTAWRSSDVAHQVAVLAALSQLGVEYRHNTSEPGAGFDCSGLTAYAWGRAGTVLARQSGSQISAAAPRDHETAQAGDLVQYPGHVMMYLGVPRTFVHASNPENDVELWMTSPDRAAGLRYGDPTE
jgi:cell wall-associated NlpC family hydrolase